MQRCFANVLSTDIEKTSMFYEALLGMTRHYDSDWFIILTHKQVAGLEFGIIQKEHDFIPPEIRRPSGGMMITFVVADCDKAFNKALEIDAKVIQSPTDMPYGQRRMLLCDPDGTVLDVSASTA